MDTWFEIVVTIFLGVYLLAKFINWIDRRY